jgi:hypothetical protein
MKTRTMTVQPDSLDIKGAAWGAQPPEIVIEEWGEGDVIRRVRIPVRPADIEVLGRLLWDLRGKYEKALSDMTRALKGE